MIMLLFMTLARPVKGIQSSVAVLQLFKALRKNKDLSNLGGAGGGDDSN